jgi:hypothetical protein
MSTYASIADFHDWSNNPADDEDIQLALDEAEFDVDNYMAGVINPTTGLRLDTADLEVWRLERLVRAVVFQAEYRIDHPDIFSDHGVGDEVIEGPDFTISGKRPRFSARAARELKAAGLLLTGARAVP